MQSLFSLWAHLAPVLFDQEEVLSAGQLSAGAIISIMVWGGSSRTIDCS